MIAVSVIVPVYNAEKHLRQCLDSLCGQSLPDIEFICVNDGSTDGSLTILNEYARKDGRFTVVDQANCGSGQSRNNGLKVARGEYVGFVDADDIVSRNYFETLYAEGGNGECDIVATSRVRLFADGGGRMREKDVASG